MSDAVSAGNWRVRAGVPAMLVVVGSSMAPGLRPGWRLRVLPLDAPPAAGDVVVLRSGARLHGLTPDGSGGGDEGARESVGMPVTSGGEPSPAPRTEGARATPAFVVHRVVWVADIGGQLVVFHRGDAGGRVGLTRGDAVVGRVAGVLAGPAAAHSAGEGERTVPALDALDAAQRRAFLHAQWRCRVYVALRRAAAYAGLAPASERAAVARLAALVRRLLLRA